MFKKFDSDADKCFLTGRATTTIALFSSADQGLVYFDFSGEQFASWTNER